MRIDTIQIKNFRSLCGEAEFELDDLTVLIGENDAGKSTIIDAIRIFYEDESFDAERDLPKAIPQSEREELESWIQIVFELNEDEWEDLPDKYQEEDRRLKLRKFLQTDAVKVKSRDSNIYFIDDEGERDQDQFFGAVGVSIGKLGKRNLIYIPDVRDTDDVFKTSGPSPFRDIVNNILGRVVEKHDDYQELKTAFESFDESIHSSTTADGQSLEQVVGLLNDELEHLGIEFQLEFTPIDPKEMVKRLLEHKLLDLDHEEEVDKDVIGSGVRRYLVYSLLRVTSRLTSALEPSSEEGEFSADFNLLLFEEPEAFLHPNQEEKLNTSLRTIAEEANQQVIITTHSPNFVAKNIRELSNIVKLKKPEACTSVHQLRADELESLFSVNTKLYDELNEILEDDEADDSLQNHISNKYIDEDSNYEKIAEEELRYFLWMNSERTKSLFADKVLIVEGYSDKVFIDYLVGNKWGELADDSLYVLNVGGKPNVPAYMNLFESLGVEYAVLIDRDKEDQVHTIINNYIEERVNKHEFALGVDYFEDEFEESIGLEDVAEVSNRRKPLYIMMEYEDGNVDDSDVEGLRGKIGELIEE